MEFPPEDALSQLAVILESSSDTDSEEDEDDQEEAALLQERDEAKEKLTELEYASQALLVELSTLEAEYEIEKSCREQAEAYAAQMNVENKKLKRISVALLPMLGHLPGDLANEDEITAEPGMDPVSQYLQQIKDLQAKVSQLLREKKELTMQVKELRDQSQHLHNQLEEERAERRSLQSAAELSQKALKRVKRESQLVTEEYGEVSRQLDLEQELRQQAEVFAHQMLVKQKEANRQSMILMQKVRPDVQLLQALEDVATATRVLDEAKQEHQAKVKDLEAQLAQRPPLSELHRLQAALATAEGQNVCLEKRLVQTEERNTALEEKVKSLEEKTTMSEAPPPSPVAPPPPPPPPPPMCPAPVDPLLAIRQRKGARQAKCDKRSAAASRLRSPAAHLKPRADTQAGTDDFKAKAVDEMMARIKSGVVLRPAKRDPGTLSKVQSAAADKRRSATMELLGLLSTVKKPVRKQSRRKDSQKLTNTQLESILQRRRQMTECPAQPPAPQQQRSSISMERGPFVPAQGAKASPHSAPEGEPPRSPPPSMQCFREPSQSLTGDGAKAAAQAPALSEQKDPLPATPRFLQRAAFLQRRRRIIVPAPGAESTH